MPYQPNPGITAEIIADSISPAGVRLTTIAVRVPTVLWAQVLTHRAFSRNAQSMRAVPTSRLIEQVEDDPFVPYFTRRDKGMVGIDDLTAQEQETCRNLYLRARHDCITSVKTLKAMGASKEAANRLLTPWTWTHALISATHWGNYFGLRIASDVQHEHGDLAAKMLAAMQASEPVEREDSRLDLQVDQWHLPYITEDERHAMGHNAALVSAARCARVSYAPFDGNGDFAAEMARASKLREAGHWSPLEHQAYPASESYYPSGNLFGWHQLRQQFKGECRDFDITGGAA